MPSSIETSFLYSLLNENLLDQDDTPIPLTSSHIHFQGDPPSDIQTPTSCIPSTPDDHESQINNPANPTERPTITQDHVPPDPLPPLHRSTRLHTEPIRYGFVAWENLDDKNNNPSFTAVMRGANKLQWRKAMQDEFDSFTEHNIGTLVDPPPDANILGVKTEKLRTNVNKVDTILDNPRVFSFLAQFILETGRFDYLCSYLPEEEQEGK
ncbi:hypothetical protein CROQUDRAFT_108140 [Cronartium quercuum f. sp. fusiforme G11]|uniref:Uncharacterized protein n=1 Tax=Cronartium quercuum f. sp. fusiforme G11 TaxID=708437 RepID=A0A9P6TAA5_9BASI|nr:hypothetical protein CROQUDRAFT_108140 [Cronartium quercuum f. sp. fusiforme G11]